MNWYKNLKIKTRFVFCFGIISILVFILGFIGIYANYSTNSNYQYAIKFNAESVTKGIEVIKDVTDLRVQSLINLSKINSSNLNSIKKEMQEVYEKARLNMESYLKIIEEENIDGSRNEEKNLINDIINLLEEYYVSYISYIDAKAVGDTKKIQDLEKQLANVGDNFFANIYESPLKAFNSLGVSIQNVENISRSERIQLLIIFILIQIAVIMFAIRLTMSMKTPIESLKNIALNIAKGDLRVSPRTDRKDEIGELSNAVADMSETFQSIMNDINELSRQLDNGYISYRIDTSKYQGVFKQVTDAINISTNNIVEDSLYVINKIKDFGNGNFDVEIKEFKNEKVVIKEGIKIVQYALKNVSDNIKKLIEAGSEGNLEFRLETSSYVGQWKEITEGLNQFVENVVIPIKETQNALNQFAIGNFEYRITKEAKGEFNNINQSVNYTGETVGSYISEISNILQQMANKNFDISMEREYLGDFKAIQQSLNLIVENFNELIKDIIYSAEKVSDGAKQISQSSVALAEGATEQAGSVEQINSTVSLISSQSRENAENSKKANNLAINAKESANEGSKQMDNMLLAMEEIKIASKSISNIIKVIEDIAFQTNILALNAAVEAARAGEHGKGFAVVAEEVRSLAGRSQEAAKETTELIESSVEKVIEGSKIANNTADALVNIVGQIEEISNLIHSCAISSKEQEKSIDEMTQGIKQIAIVTQNNTATSQESAAASEELANQAEMFYTSVSDFKLREDL